MSDITSAIRQAIQDTDAGIKAIRKRLKEDVIREECLQRQRAVLAKLLSQVETVTVTR